MWRGERQIHALSSYRSALPLILDFKCSVYTDIIADKVYIVSKIRPFPDEYHSDLLDLSKLVARAFAHFARTLIQASAPPPLVNADVFLPSDNLTIVHMHHPWLIDLSDAQLWDFVQNVFVQVKSYLIY